MDAGEIEQSADRGERQLEWIGERRRLNDDLAGCRDEQLDAHNLSPSVEARTHDRLETHHRVDGEPGRQRLPRDRWDEYRNPLVRIHQLERQMVLVVPRH